MVKLGITLGCSAALLVAAVIVVRLRDTRRTPSPLDGTEPFGARLAVTAGRAGGMLAGAYLAGMLTLGAGIRLMMRVIAATSPDEVQGLRTEADEVIGRASVNGSLFLIVFVGIGAAAVGVALYASLRAWLPERSIAAGLVGVAMGAGVLVRPVGLLTADNRDFRLVAPVLLVVVLCVLTLALFGMTLGVLVDHVGARWAKASLSPRGVAALLPFAPLLLAPPLFVGAVLVVVASAAAAGPPSGWGARVGRIAVLTGGALGCVSIAVAAGEVLTL